MFESKERIDKLEELIKSLLKFTQRPSFPNKNCQICGTELPFHDGRCPKLKKNLNDLLEEIEKDND